MLMLCKLYLQRIDAASKCYRTIVRLYGKIVPILAKSQSADHEVIFLPRIRAPILIKIVINLCPLFFSNCFLKLLHFRGPNLFY